MRSPTMMPEAQAELGAALKLVTVIKDNISISAGSRFNDAIAISVPAGYTCVAFRTITISNATTSGGGAGSCRLYGFSAAGSSIYCRFANDGSGTARIRIECVVLCARNDLL